MEIIATYPSYQEANDRQLDLLACDIGAKVIRESTGFMELYFGSLPKYHLIVHEKHADEARERLKLVRDPEHKHIASCRNCGSGNVTELGIDDGIGSLGWLFFPAIVKFFQLRMSGPKFRCGDCSHEYRKKI